MATKKTSQGKGRKAVALAKATRKFSVRSERKAPRGGGKKGGTDNPDVTLEP